MDGMNELADELVRAAPYRGYLNRDALLAAALSRLAELDQPPDDLRHWLSGVAEDCFLKALLLKDLRTDPVAAKVLDTRLRLLLGPVLAPWLRRSPIRHLVNPSSLIQASHQQLAEYRRKHAGALPERPGAWLVTVVRNRCKRLYENWQKRPGTVELPDEGYLVETRERPVGAEMANHEEIERLLGNDPVIRQLYQLRIVEGLSWDEVGLRMGKKANSLNVLWNRWLENTRRQQLAENEPLVAGEKHEPGV